MPTFTKPAPDAQAPPAHDVISPTQNHARVLDRARRVAECEREVFAAIAPILARHNCRLGTVQEIIDGAPGTTRVILFANE